MNKIAGELTPTAFHVSCAHGCDPRPLHLRRPLDVMFCRTTGFAMLSSTPPGAMDLALIAIAATPRNSHPFLHFFDGFRTSHEVNKIELLTKTTCVPSSHGCVIEHRQRALSPDPPVFREVTARIPTSSFRRGKPAILSMSLSR